jgi:hypothetical protein
MVNCEGKFKLTVRVLLFMYQNKYIHRLLAAYAFGTPGIIFFSSFCERLAMRNALFEVRFSEVFYLFDLLSAPAVYT